MRTGNSESISRDGHELVGSDIGEPGKVKHIGTIWCLSCSPDCTRNGAWMQQKDHAVAEMVIRDGTRLSEYTSPVLVVVGHRCISEALWIIRQIFIRTAVLLLGGPLMPK